MPYTIRKRSCRQSSGKKGKYTLSYTDKNGKRHSNCHTSRKRAQGQIAAIEGPKEGMCEDEGCSCQEGYSNLSHRGDFFGNPYEDPGEEFDIDPDDPIGLVRAAVRAELDRQIHDGRRR